MPCSVRASFFTSESPFKAAFFSDAHRGPFDGLASGGSSSTPLLQATPSTYMPTTITEELPRISNNEEEQQEQRLFRDSVATRTPSLPGLPSLAVASLLGTSEDQEAVIDVTNEEIKEELSLLRQYSHVLCNNAHRKSSSLESETTTATTTVPEFQAFHISATLPQVVFTRETPCFQASDVDGGVMVKSDATALPALDLPFFDGLDIDLLATIDIASASLPLPPAGTTTTATVADDNVDFRQIYESFVHDPEYLPPVDIDAFFATPEAASVIFSTGGGGEKTPTTTTLNTSQADSSLESSPPEARSTRSHRRQKRFFEEGPLLQKTPNPVSKKSKSGPASTVDVNERDHCSRAKPRAVAQTPLSDVYAMLPAKNGCELVSVRCHHLFSKVVTASDVGKLGRIVIPRNYAEEHLPRCQHRSGINLMLWDVHGNSYACIYKFWMNGRPPCKRMWVLDQCHNVIHALNLTPGAQLDFYKSKDGRFVVHCLEG